MLKIPPMSHVYEHGSDARVCVVRHHDPPALNEQMIELTAVLD